MLAHDLTIALRRFARQRFHTAVGVAVLTLGLVCFIAANLFVSYVRGYDRHWPNADRIYVIAERVRAPQFGVTPSFDTGTAPPVAEQLRVEAPELAAVARVYGQPQVLAVDDRRVTLSVAYAEPQFTEIFEFTTLAGDGPRPLAAPRSAVITERAAVRLFGAVDVVGRSLTMMVQQPVDITIRAVVADIPEQSHLKPGALLPSSSGADVFVSWDVLEASGPLAATNWGSRAVKTYVLLPRDGALARAELDRRLAKIAAERVPPDWQFLKLDLESRPVSAVAALKAQNDFQGNWGGNVWVDVLAVLRTAAVVILAIASLNFLNLAMAHGTGRALDVSTRKVLGAKTWHIVRQDLLHTGLVVALALVLAVAAIVPLAKLFAAPWSSSLDVPWSEPWFIAFLGSTLCAVTVAGGLYPAIVAARARRAAASSVHGARDALARVRAILVSLQFAAAGALVVGAIVLLMQRHALHDALVGRFADQYVAVFVPQNDPAALEVLTNELMRGPGILGTTSMSPPPFLNAPRRFSRARGDSTPSVMIDFIYTTHDYFDVMQVPLVAGRVFSRERADDAQPSSSQEWAERRGRPPGIVLDRTAARAFGWPEPRAAVGQLIYAPGGAPNEIVGIVEPALTSIRASDSTGTAYVLSSSPNNFRIVRVASDRVDAALEHIDKSVKSVFPALPTTNRVFFDQVFESYYQTFELTNRLLAGLAVFALLISGIGLFGMATYLADRRTREIGIRKCQGATPANILRLLLWDFSKPVVWANPAVWPLVVIALDRYLSLFAERVAITPLPFVLALATTWLLACLTVARCAWRAAKLHPAEALRQ
jgi:putative ABC transport system permease protein